MNEENVALVAEVTPFTGNGQQVAENRKRVTGNWSFYLATGNG
jgi:hypothetical protein